MAERARSSLFYLPALFILAAAAAAGIVDWVDDRFDTTFEAIPLLVSASVDSARSVLSVIAAATITVAGIVFSVTVVSVQLASSQFSPRVLRGFLRDRFSQVVIGWVVATFTYCLLLLATTRADVVEAGEPSVSRNLGLTIALVLAVTAILAIVAFIDHSARTMQVGELIRRITEETRERIAVLWPERAGEGIRTELPTELPEGPAFTATADADGWVQQIDQGTLLRCVPPGGAVIVEVRVGSFVVDGTPLARLWPAPDDGDETTRRVRGAFVLGRGRTMQQDVAFGIRQLVDIGLRALSPGVNDPTTAYDVLANLGAVLGDLLRRDPPPRVVAGAEGRRLYRPRELSLDAYVDRALDQIRVAAVGQPGMALSMLATVGMLVDLLRRSSLEARAVPLYRQAALVVAGVEVAGHLPEDVERVRARARELALIDDGPVRHADD